MKAFNLTIMLVLTILAMQKIVSADGFDQAVTDFKERNYTAAFRKLNELALNGDPRAQNTLAMMYSRGYGINIDQQKAEQWLLAASRTGYANAQTNLGILYEEGRTGIPNYTEAFNWYNQAALQGDPRAQYRLGKLMLSGRGTAPNRDRAFEQFVRSAEQGYEPAIRILIVTYNYNLASVPR